MTKRILFTIFPLLTLAIGFLFFVSGCFYNPEGTHYFDIYPVETLPYEAKGDATTRNKTLILKGAIHELPPYKGGNKSYITAYGFTIVSDTTEGLKKYEFPISIADDPIQVFEKETKPFSQIVSSQDAQNILFKLKKDEKIYYRAYAVTRYPIEDLKYKQATEYGYFIEINKNDLP